jgi:glycosidase
MHIWAEELRRRDYLVYGHPFPEQASLTIGYLFTSQGVPCIYCGTEQGFDGGERNKRRTG